MPGRWTRVASALCAGLVLLVVGCSGDDGENGNELGPVEWKASVYESIVREVGLPEAKLSMPEDATPTIYLATSDGSGISPEVQAAVVRAVRDEADLQVEDDVNNVILTDEPGKPVRDDGLLLTISPLPEQQSNRVVLETVIYRSELLERSVMVELRRAGEAWSVEISAPG